MKEDKILEFHQPTRRKEEILEKGKKSKIGRRLPSSVDKEEATDMDLGWDFKKKKVQSHKTPLSPLLN